MTRLGALALLAMALIGCAKTGVSADESRHVNEQFSQGAYEEAMIKAGKGEELAKEKENWAKHNAGAEDQEKEEPATEKD